MYKFQKFEKKNNRFETRITITASSAIGFPSRFYEDNNIKDMKYVVMFFDKENNAVGIGLTNNDAEKNKFKIVHNKKSSGATVSIKSFFKNNNIDSRVYKGRYVWKKEDVENFGSVYVLNLSDKKIEAKN